MLVVMLLVVKVIGSRSRRYFAAQQKAMGDVNGYIEEMIEGQKVIKVFNHEAGRQGGLPRSAMRPTGRRPPAPRPMPAP